MKQIASEENQNTVKIIDSKQTNGIEILQIVNKHLIENMNHLNTNCLFNVGLNFFINKAF